MPGRGRNTYYVHDATGNIMATYCWNNMDSFHLTDVPIYGSARIASWSPSILLWYNDSSGLRSGAASGMGLWAGGSKVYELNNHLGNVLSTVSDRKLRVYSGGHIDHYLAEVITATDYYPFGMPMLNRSFGASYRFGFNGKEQDNEVEGKGDILDFGARIYDSRIGRLLSVDPLLNKYPTLSPYCLVANNAINAIDPKGKDVYLLVWATADGQIGHAAIAVTNYKDVVKTSVVNGKTLTYVEHVPDGTFTYRDLWPGGSGAGPGNYDKKIDAAFNSDQITSEKSLCNYQSGEGRAPDGVLKIKTTDFGQTETKVMNTLNKEETDQNYYCGTTHNCSDYASSGFEELLGVSGLGKEQIPGAGLSTTPNQLWNDVKELGTKMNKEITVLKDPGNKVNNTFLEGKGGAGFGKIKEGSKEVTKKH